MKYQSNENPTYGYFTNDALGMVSYIKDTKTVVEQISFDINEFVMITGESGSGKSTVH